MKRTFDRTIDSILLTACSTLILIALSFAVKYLSAETNFPVGVFIAIVVLGFSIIYRIIERRLKKRFGSAFIAVVLLIIPTIIALLSFFISYLFGEEIALFGRIFGFAKIFMVLCALIIATRLITLNIATVFGTLVSLGSSIVYIAASLALLYLGQTISVGAVPFTLIVGGAAIFAAYINVEKKLSSEFKTHWGYTAIFLLAVPTLVSVALYCEISALERLGYTRDIIEGLTEKRLAFAFLVLMISMFFLRLVMLLISTLRKRSFSGNENQE